MPVRPRYDRLKLGFHGQDGRSLFRYVFDVVEQRSTMALFTARAGGGSGSTSRAAVPHPSTKLPPRKTARSDALTIEMSALEARPPTAPESWL